MNTKRPAARRAADHARAVVPRDPAGKIVLVPEGYTIRWTQRGAFQQYLEYRDNGVPKGESSSFDSLQTRIDSCLRALLDGRPADEVFWLDKPKSHRPTGRPKNVGREQAMALEMCRLTLLHEISSAAAMNDVARAFEAEVKTVERAFKTWRKDPRFAIEDIRQYECSLKLRKLLK